MAKAKTTPTAQTPPAEVSPELIQNAADAAGALTIYGQNPLELVMPDTMHEHDYLAYGSRIGAAMKFASWRIGDYVNFGVTKFNYKDYEKISGVTGLPEDYLRQCASVAGRVALEFRADASLEKARLMLQNKGKNESVAKLFKRLASKTHKQLRKMRSSGGGGGGTETEVTAGEIYGFAQRLISHLEAFDSEKKLPMLVQLESDKDSGGVINQLASFLRELTKQLVDAGVKYEA